MPPETATAADRAHAVLEGRGGTVAAAPPAPAAARTGREAWDLPAAPDAARPEAEQFAYAASHDLQEPLRMVKGFLRLFLERTGPSLDPDSRALVVDALAGAERVQHMLNDLLDYSRVDGRDARRAATDLTLCLQGAVDNLRFALQEAGAEVRHARLPAVDGDEGLLVRLFQNLVGNAVKFRGRDPPRVDVAAVREGPAWHVTVKDNGIGIDPKHIPTLFQPFRRLHSTDAYPGTGMGLAIAKRIVEVHGGRIWLESRGAGTTVHFTLPERRA